jgi:hypothetical protein
VWVLWGILQVLEYRVERLAEDDPRMAAAAADEANGGLLRSPPPSSPRHQPKPHTPKSSGAEVCRSGPLGVHVPKLARTSSKGTPKGSRGNTPRTPGGGWTQAAKTLGTPPPEDNHKVEPGPPPLLRLPPVKLELLQEDEQEEGQDGDVPLTKKQVMDDLTAVFNAVMAHYRHPDDDDAGDDDHQSARAPLSAHALQVCALRCPCSPYTPGVEGAKVRARPRHRDRHVVQSQPFQCVHMLATKSRSLVANVFRVHIHSMRSVLHR